LDSEVVDDHDIEIIEKYVIVNQTEAKFVETLPFQHNKHELQHSDLGDLATHLALPSYFKSNLTQDRHLVFYIIIYI